MKYSKLLAPFIALIMLLSMVAAPAVVSAHYDEDDDDGYSKDKDHESDKSKQTDEEKAEALRKAEAEKAAKLAAAEKAKSETRKKNFKTACENHADAYSKRLKNLTRQLQKHMEQLDAIVWVDEFVTNKNLTVENYDALLAAAKAKGQAVADMHSELVTLAENFNCGNSPEEAKAALAAFKEAFKKEVSALKEYREAVRSLIKAVKTAAQGPKEEESDES